MRGEVRLHVRGDPEIRLEPGAAGGGDYALLANKPSIQGVALVGDRTLPELGITPEGLGIDPDALGERTATNRQILALFG